MTNPDDHLTTQLQSIIEGLRNAEVAVIAERQAREADIKANQKKTDSNEKKAHNAFIAAFVGLIVGGIGLLVGGVAVNASSEAQKAIDDVVEVRTESRIGSCLQDNIRIGQHNELVKGTRKVKTAAETVQTEIDRILSFSTSNPREEPTPEDQERIRQFTKLYAELTAEVAEALEAADESLNQTIIKPRDCSLEGIDAYFEATNN